jgi:glycosyltransferase involved in cell wall biosynthesis
MTVPKVSVLIPTYNYARYLPEAIESILAQDFRNFELLISDDCSTDNSAEVIARYAARDSRIRFQIHSANLGMVQNWNWCLSQARGEYIKFIFGDDRLATRQALGGLIELLETNASAVLAVSARSVIDENSKIVEVWDDLGSSGLYQGREIIARCWERNCCNLIGEPSAVLFRKRDAARNFDVAYRQIVDLEMWLHLLEKGDLAYTTEALCCFRRHRQQQSEVNHVNQVVEREGLRLFFIYDRKAYLKARLRMGSFNQLYNIKKHLKRHRGQDADMLQAERELSARLGKFWYAACWLRHKITKPFLNLQRSLKKRLPVAVPSGFFDPL